MTTNIIETVPDTSKETMVENVEESNQTALPNNPEDAQTIHETPRQILKKNALPIAECFFIGFFLGINDGNFGVILPRIKEYYNISDGLVSILFICQAIGYFIAAFSNGWIVHKIKQVGALYLGAGLTVVAYVLLLIGLPFPAMCCFMPILGAAGALMDAGANVFPSFLPYGTTLLNFIHAFYGLGSLTGPLMASSLYASNLSWKVSYMILAGISVLNCILMYLAFRGVVIEEHNNEILEIQPGDEFAVTEKPVEKHGRFGQSIRLKFTWIVAFFLLFYVGIETTVGGWGYTFLTTARNGDAVQMGRVMSGYWAGLTVGRVILGHITAMFGEKRMVTLYLFITCGMVILVWQATSIGTDAAGLVIMGAALGPMFPTAISVSHQTLPKHLHATAVGFLVAFGSAGVAFFPFINGQVVDKAGINSMMPYTLGLAIAGTIMWIVVPSPVPVFGVLSKLTFKRSKTVEESLPPDQENSTIAYEIGRLNGTRA